MLKARVLGVAGVRAGVRGTAPSSHDLSLEISESGEALVIEASDAVEALRLCFVRRPGKSETTASGR